MKKIRNATSLALCLLLLSVCLVFAGCKREPGLPERGSVERGDLTLFPKPEVGYAGDPIPFFDGEKLNLYYIHDSRTYGLFHPWNLFQTEDFCSWQDRGVAIAGGDKGVQDYGIGTGTVLRGHDGKYHAFYTGWNGYSTNVEFTEKVQHAVSQDLINWTKILEDGFFGGVNDFRDPHVVWVEEDNKYWMLVSTWNTAAGYKPALKWYKSSNLSDWEYCGIYFDDNEDGDFMECPTLLEYNGYWYLSWFQKAVDGTNARVTRYRYKKNLSDPEWIRPKIDYFDGAGLSAARLVPFKDNRLMVVGWIGTKIADYDLGDFTWAGNLAVHELRQNSDGTLYTLPVKEVAERLDTRVAYPVTFTSPTAEYDGDSVSFTGTDYEYLLYGKLAAKPTKMTFALTAQGGKAGMTFARKGVYGYGELTIQFDLDARRVEFYNRPPSGIDKVSQAFAELEPADSYTCTVLWGGECLSLYINGKIALSTRMYSMAGKDFGFYAADTAAKFTGIRFYE